MNQQRTSLPHVSPAAGAAFAELGLIEPLVRAVNNTGYTTPTPVQAGAIPYALAGRDVLGCAQTGTGKTAAFALPILQRLSQAAPTPSRSGRTIRALILSPTRELAAQIARSFESYGRHTGLRSAVIYGGVSAHGQISTLRRGVDILVATPGRLCDLLAQGVVRLSNVEVLVLDEADRMLDEGFLPDVRRIIDVLPQRRQTLLFSATMPAGLRPLVDRVLVSPARVEATPVASTPDLVEQAVYLVEQEDKRALLRHLLEDHRIARAIVFTRTKHGANRVAEHLVKGRVQAEAIHGNKSQSARERTLARFRDGSIRVLVATDVAARGIDVAGVTHVVNFDVPNDPEAYVHRIGRTARAGAAGAALSFCSRAERGQLASIERLIKRRVAVQTDHPYAPAAGAGLPRSERSRPPHAATADHGPPSRGDRPTGLSDRRYRHGSQPRFRQAQERAGASGTPAREGGQEGPTQGRSRESSGRRWR